MWKALVIGLIHHRPFFLFSFVSFLCMHWKLSVFLHLCSVGLCHLVTEGPEKGEWIKPSYCGEGGLGGAEGVFITDLDGFSLQYSRFMSSWSCFVGPRDLIISLPASFLCGSAVLGLRAFLPTNPNKVLLSLFLSYFLTLSFFPFPFI